MGAARRIRGKRSAFTGGRVTRARYAVRGFSLVELLVALAVFAVLFSLAAPGFRELADRLALDGEYNRLARDLRLARGEAIARQRTVSLCAREGTTDCGDDWSRGWHVFVDLPGGARGELEPGEQLLATRRGNGAGRFDLRARAVVRPGGMAERPSLSFDARGRTDWTIGTIEICTVTGTDGVAGLVVGGAGGFRRAAGGAGSPEVVLDAMGEAITCGS